MGKKLDIDATEKKAVLELSGLLGDFTSRYNAIREKYDGAFTTDQEGRIFGIFSYYVNQSMCAADVAKSMAAMLQGN